MGSVSTPDTQIRTFEQATTATLISATTTTAVAAITASTASSDIFYTQGGTIGGYVTTKQQQKSFQEKPVEIKHLFLKPILNYNNKFPETSYLQQQQQQHSPPTPQKQQQQQHYQHQTTQPYGGTGFMLYSQTESIFITSGR